MKSYIAITLFLAIFFKNFGQTDTLHSGIYQTDTLRGDTIECYPYGCSITKCHTWYIGITEGVIHVTGDPADFYEVTITTFGNFVHRDTCVTLFPFAGGDYLIYNTFGANAQITVCGPENATIIIIAKPDTSQPHPPLKPAFLRLDTLCGATAIDQPRTPSKYYYELDEVKKAGMTGIRPKVVAAGDRKPGVAYIRANGVYLE